MYSLVWSVKPAVDNNKSVAVCVVLVTVAVVVSVGGGEQRMVGV